MTSRSKKGSKAVTFLNHIGRPDSDFAALSHRGAGNQKTFAPLRAVLQTPGTETNKVFLLLFVHKKKCFLLLACFP
jgi:hypothetical protein